MMQHELERLERREEFCRKMTVQEQMEFCRIMDADMVANTGYFSPEMWESNNKEAIEVRSKYYLCKTILGKKEGQRIYKQRRAKAMQNGDKRLTEQHLALQEGKCAHCGISFDKLEHSTRPELDHKIPLTRSGRGAECSHCGHQWTPRSEHAPKRCPKCKFHYSLPSSLHTIENTWLLCAACHQAKTYIEISWHVLLKHRWKSIWLSRSKDGKWHLPRLKALADKTCGVASVDPLRFPWCRKCKVIAAGYLMRPHQITSRDIERGGDGSAILDALGFYKSINDRQSVTALEHDLLIRRQQSNSFRIGHRRH